MMTIKTRLILMSVLLGVSACSTQSVQPVENDFSTATDTEVTVTPLSADNKSVIPGLTQIKSGKTLVLVRIMEGGMCNLQQQGAVGTFNLYANPEDIERIKQQHGNSVFAGFESQIESFSMQALQQAVEKMDFSTGNNKLGKQALQQQLADRLADLFTESVANDIAQFEANTTLMIDVKVNSESMTIYQDNCEMPSLE